MINKFTKQILLFFLFLVSVSFATERIYVAPINYKDIHQDYAKKSYALFQKNLEKDKLFQLVPSTSDELTFPKTTSQFRLNATAKNCPLFVTMDFSRNGDFLVLEVNLYETNSEKKLSTDEQIVPAPDKLDSIISSMADKMRNAVNQPQDLSQPTVQEKTLQTTNEAKKKAPFIYLGLGASGLEFFNPKTEINSGMNIFMLFNLQPCLINIQIDYYGFRHNSKYEYVDIATSLFYPISDGFASPFIGGGFALSQTFIENSGDKNDKICDYNEDYCNDDGSRGISGMLGAGVLINRGHRFMGYIQAKYLIDFYNTESFRFEEENKNYIIHKKKDLMNAFVGEIGVSIGL